MKYSRKKAIVALSLMISLTACAGAGLPPQKPIASSLDSFRLQFGYEILSLDASLTSDQMKAKIAHFLNNITLHDGDIFILEPPNPAQPTPLIADFLKRHNIHPASTSESSRFPVQAAQRPNQIRLTIETVHIQLPPCGWQAEWSQSASNAPSAHYGCADRQMLANAIANPRDLLRQTHGPDSTPSQRQALQIYLAKPATQSAP